MRAFVALELPPEVGRAVAGVQSALREAASAADVRWSDPRQLHVTLKFLGNVEDDRVGALRGALAAATARVASFACTTGAPGAFPHARRPRVMWLGVSAPDGALAALAAAVDAALAPLGFPAEERPYHAHLTLGRVRSPRGLGPLVRALDEIRTGPARTWEASDIVLFQSETRPSGAVHAPVARFALGPRI